MIFESHAHYEDERFDEDRDLILGDLSRYNIETVINVGSTMATTEKSVEFAKQYRDVYAAVGVHPSEIDCLDETGMERLKELAVYGKTVAIGEIGLDYYWEKEQEQRKKQQYWFKRQMSLAKEVGLPVIIHSRDAAADTMEIMRECHAEQMTGVVHCYSYSPQMAKEFVKMGWYIGVGGVVTFKNAKNLKETVAQIPLDKILLETDCPYMAPEPHRGERNSSLYLPYIAEKIAEIKGIAAEEVIEQTRRNARALFAKVM